MYNFFIIFIYLLHFIYYFINISRKKKTKLEKNNYKRKQIFLEYSFLSKLIAVYFLIVAFQKILIYIKDKTKDFFHIQKKIKNKNNIQSLYLNEIYITIRYIFIILYYYIRKN